MMGIVMPETCWAYKKYNNKWHLVGFLFFSFHKDARSNKYQILPKYPTDSISFYLAIIIFPCTSTWRSAREERKFSIQSNFPLIYTNIITDINHNAQPVSNFWDKGVEQVDSNSLLQALFRRRPIYFAEVFEFDLVNLFDTCSLHKGKEHLIGHVYIFVDVSVCSILRLDA